jgi:hypothetical protein
MFPVEADAEVEVDGARSKAGFPPKKPNGFSVNPSRAAVPASATVSGASGCRSDAVFSAERTVLTVIARLLQLLMRAATSVDAPDGHIGHLVEGRAGAGRWRSQQAGQPVTYASDSS